MHHRPSPLVLLTALVGIAVLVMLTARAGGEDRRAAPRAAVAVSATPPPITLPAEPEVARDHVQVKSKPQSKPGAWRRKELRRLRSSRTVRGALRRAWLSGAITTAEHDGWRSDLHRAENAAKRLKGVRGAHQRTALAIVKSVARRRALPSGRMPLAFLQLRRNTAWWTRHGPPGRDITWGEDPVTLRPVAGAALVVHPLASWGRVNALAGKCVREPESCPRDQLRSALRRMTDLGTTRHGALAWEHMFRWHGGRPGWVSAMVQGTAIQALARGGKVLGERRWVRAASRALTLFERRPPVGVTARGRSGPYYVMYSQRPNLRILNGFLQTLVGLRDMARYHDSERAQRLYRRGDREARRMLRVSDTGAWSLYSTGGRESTLGYHQLTGGFLMALCSRAKRGTYCSAKKRFVRYEREPPRMKVRSAERPRAGDATLLRFSLSKISNVTVEVRGPDGKRAWSSSMRISRGGHAVRWRPERKGTHRIRIVARGPSGPKGVAKKTVQVRRSRAAVAAERRARARARARKRAEARKREQARERAKERKRRKAEQQRKAEAEAVLTPPAATPQD